MSEKIIMNFFAAVMVAFISGIINIWGYYKTNENLEKQLKNNIKQLNLADKKNVYSELLNYLNELSFYPEVIYDDIEFENKFGKMFNSLCIFGDRKIIAETYKVYNVLHQNTSGYYALSQDKLNIAHDKLEKMLEEYDSNKVKKCELDKILNIQQDQEIIEYKKNNLVSVDFLSQAIANIENMIRKDLEIDD